MHHLINIEEKKRGKKKNLGVIGRNIAAKAEISTVVANY